MDRIEHLLTILGEEALEIAHRVTKALRFGLAETQPGQTFTNAERIGHEVMDLIAALEMLSEQGIELNYITEEEERRLIDAKKAKVEALLVYSTQLGTLQSGANHAS